MSEQTASRPKDTEQAAPSGDERARYHRMVLNEAWLSMAGLALIIGLIARRDGLVLFGATLLTVSVVARTWNKFALRGVSYERALEPRRAFIGESVELAVTVENRKFLPVGWVRIDDEWPEGLALIDSDDVHPSAVAGRDVLRNAFSLQWYERVRRRYRIQCEARGYYRMGPARAVSGDIFGMYRTDHRFPDLTWLIVYPRVLPLEALGLPPKDPFGETAARQRIFEDPSRTIGVRDHQPEDEFRRIHWKATARRQALQVKVYEPTTSFTMAVLLNVATLEKHWLGTIPALLERTITVAASVCDYGYERRYTVGLIANGCIPRSDQPIRVLPGRDPQQLTRILEALAAVRPVATEDISTLLTHESPRLSWGATLVVVTAYVSAELESTLLRLHAAGRRLVLISLAPDPPSPLVSQEILTYHLPDAASAYIPLPTGTASRVTTVARRDAVLDAWSAPSRGESEVL